MRLCYTLLSPTWGMHLYTADLANRSILAGYEVHLVTTCHLPRDRYAPDVRLHTPVSTTNSGFSTQGLGWGDLRRASHAVRRLQADLVHFTGPHLWNPLLLRALRREGVPTVHTLHDLHPHHGAAYGRLLYLWNGWVQREAGHLLVHGQRYRQELLKRGLAPSQVTNTPLTHLFVGHEQEQALSRSLPEIDYEPWALFLGRLEAYKGLGTLVEAARQIDPLRIVIAGPGRLEALGQGPIPGNVEVRNRQIDDEEAVELFRRCGLVVLPYVEASQSALAAATYFFQKPVVVSRVGALPEYVVEGETGWVVRPGDPQTLAHVLGTSLEDPARLAEMGRAGRAWYEGQRQSETATLQSLYARLAKQTPAP
jgi:glycosyltransferase involved in cell wall biosynthesis